MMVVYLLHFHFERKIEWRLARTWPGDRQLERWLKRKKGAGWFCPICAGEKAMRRASNYTERKQR